MSEDTKKRWAAEAEKLLKGRTITGVRYLRQGEVDDLGWCRSSIVLTLDDGNLLYPSADDEGNDAGALFTNSEDMPVIPVI
jgi:hypothetical protein